MPMRTSQNVPTRISNEPLGGAFAAKTGCDRSGSRGGGVVVAGTGVGMGGGLGVSAAAVRMVCRLQ